MDKVFFIAAVPGMLVWTARQALKLKDEVRERWDVWRVDHRTDEDQAGEGQVLHLRRAQ